MVARARIRLALTTAALLVFPILPAAPIAHAAAKPTATAAGVATGTVTLITGDQVSLAAGAPAIKPGPGRDRMSFTASKVNGRVTVIPSDVHRLVDTGRLDRQLFDVTGLIEAGYDDAHTDAIPVIVGYSAAAAKARPAISALKTSRALAAINANAGSVAKASARSFLATVATSPAIRHVWLDGKRHLLLDKSVPQIGAPAAWQAGYTGKGVRVAVIDSGIDAQHPDLASRVAGVQTFGDDLPGDQIGHGTHVASIVAGTGAASNGQYRGVAPDAELYDAKACTDTVCNDSSVLAAMEWAARDVHAQVVNISLGFPFDRADDPLEQAITTLTAETGTLFVVAAGNQGSAPGGSITSPGRAAAALTVGAVDRDDTIAPFSSRGPAPGDAVLKPDVTAPGVGIVAARSSEGTVGEPVNDYYTRISGTSMAAPHVAGAAALLLQEHPDWKAPELKSALMNSAKSAPDQGLFDQGAGRIDVARAVAQPILAGPPSISFGTADWPHADDQPVTRTITYRNTGTSPVTLTIGTELTAPDGTPAPGQALTVGTSQLTIAAGASAPVQVTSNTNHTGPDGRYTGQVIATWPDGGQVHVPVTVLKDIEAYNLTVHVIAPDGIPATGANVTVQPLDGSSEHILFGDGTVRLPPGEYAVDASLTGDATYAMVQPRVHLTADATVVFDARQARKVAIDVPTSAVQRSMQTVDYVRTMGEEEVDQIFGAFGGQDLYTLGLGDSVPDGQVSAVIASHWYGGSSAYHTTDLVNGRFPTGFQRTVRDRDLATVRTQLQHSTGDGYQLMTTASLPGHESFTEPVSVPAPITLIQHVEAAPVEWSQTLEEPTADGESSTILLSTSKSYRAGGVYQERWNAPVRSPSDVSVARGGSELSVGLTKITDADGHGGFAATTAESAKLYRGETLVGQSREYGSLFADGLPPEPATYRFETSATLTTSERIEYRATFGSQAGESTTPLWSIGYRPIVNNQNVSTWTPITRLPVLPRTAADTTIRTLRVEYSPDNGATWHPAQVECLGGRTYQAVFPTPKAAVSLRTTLTDAAGIAVTQTNLNAYVVQEAR
ncbi:S8 family serine peptidase [Kribbella sp.]|uniref:S8 family serine peptidase n=1 Tax=Kribbella sp. TaxID=1871183 RepID=UPI002D59D38B|nr:S8 family serine peptidase [Kribbella sp.]HZX03058.1 S8 family serine peptidase [Kribbella sp.]